MYRDGGGLPAMCGDWEVLSPLKSLLGEVLPQMGASSSVTSLIQEGLIP